MNKSAVNGGARSAIKLATWHRRVAIVAAVAAIWFAATGIVLNHSDDLKLGERYVRASWAVQWYGFAAPEMVVSYRAGDHWVVQLGERLYVDEHALGEYAARSATLIAGNIAILAEDRILVVSPTGRLVESLDRTAGIPSDVTALGASGNRLLARSNQGVFAADENLLKWEAYAASQVQWPSPAVAPDALIEKQVADYRGRFLSWERMLRDLHGGRIFGRVGVVLLDILALALLVIAVTGVCLWTFRRNGSKT